MAEQLHPDVIAEFREVFEIFDADKSGNICLKELEKMMNFLGNNPTEEKLSEIMLDLDKNKDGVIDFDEFIILMQQYWKDPVDEEEEILAAFQVFDRNNDGFVVADEISYVMETLGRGMTKQEVQEVIRKADIDKDGKLNYIEFVKMLQVIPPKPDGRKRKISRADRPDI